MEHSDFTFYNFEAGEMFETIRETIEHLPTEDFEEFYDDYVMSLQDMIIAKELSVIADRVLGLVSINQLEKSLNQLQEGVSSLL